MNLGKETEQVEFKRSTGEHREACESIAAILNKHGRGELYFGVRADGEVVGQDVSEKTLRDVSREIGTKIEPRIYPVIEALATEEGARYIRVLFEGSERPYACDGRYRIRQADEDVLMTTAQVRAALLESADRDAPWDSQLSERSATDLDERAVRRFVAAGNTKGRIPEPYESFDGPLDALEHLGLARDGRLTNAAEALFCPAAHGEFRLSMGVLAGNDRVDILDLRQEDGPVIALIDKAVYYILSNIRRRLVITGAPQREEVPEIPLEALREGIVNAFCHEAYRDGGRVFVDVYRDTVEITNFGLFPVGTTPEDYLTGREKGTKSRNPSLANTLFRGGYIEAFGSGLRRIRDACAAESVRFEYHQDCGETRLVFYRGAQLADVGDAELAQGGASCRELSRIVANCRELSRKTGCALSSQTERLIEKLYEEGETSAKALAEAMGITQRTVQRWLKTLQEIGAVEAHGGSRDRTYRLASTMLAEDETASTEVDDS